MNSQITYMNGRLRRKEGEKPVNYHQSIPRSRPTSANSSIRKSNNSSTGSLQSFTSKDSASSELNVSPYQSSVSSLNSSINPQSGMHFQEYSTPLSDSYSRSPLTSPISTFTMHSNFKTNNSNLSENNSIEASYDYSPSFSLDFQDITKNNINVSSEVNEKKRNRPMIASPLSTKGGNSPMLKLNKPSSFSSPPTSSTTLTTSATPTLANDIKKNDLKNKLETPLRSKSALKSRFSKDINKKFQTDDSTMKSGKRKSTSILYTSNKEAYIISGEQSPSKETRRQSSQDALSNHSQRVVSSSLAKSSINRAQNLINGSKYSPEYKQIQSINQRLQSEGQKNQSNSHFVNRSNESNLRKSISESDTLSNDSSIKRGSVNKSKISPTQKKKLNDSPVFNPKDLEILKNKIKTLWEELSITDREKYDFKGKIQGKVGIELQRIFEEEVEILSERRKNIFEILKHIHNREAYLKDILYLIESHDLNQIEDYREAENKILKLRKLFQAETESVRFYISIWREQLGIPFFKPFVWERQDYEEKMKHDEAFIHSSSIYKLFFNIPIPIEKEESYSNQDKDLDYEDHLKVSNNHYEQDESPENLIQDKKLIYNDLVIEENSNYQNSDSLNNRVEDQYSNNDSFNSSIEYIQSIVTSSLSHSVHFKHAPKIQQYQQQNQIGALLSFIDNEEAAIKIQRAWKRYHQERVNKKLNQCALKIQSNWKGYYTRTKIIPPLREESFIQRIHRSDNVLNNSLFSATRISSFYRGYKTRKTVQIKKQYIIQCQSKIRQLITNQNNILLNESLQKNSITIQSITRSIIEAINYQNLLNSIKLIQQNIRILNKRYNKMSIDESIIFSNTNIKNHINEGNGNKIVYIHSENESNDTNDNSNDTVEDYNLSEEDLNDDYTNSRYEISVFVENLLEKIILKYKSVTSCDVEEYFNSNNNELDNEMFNIKSKEINDQEETYQIENSEIDYDLLTKSNNSRNLDIYSYQQEGVDFDTIHSNSQDLHTYYTMEDVDTQTVDRKATFEENENVDEYVETEFFSNKLKKEVNDIENEYFNDEQVDTEIIDDKLQNELHSDEYYIICIQSKIRCTLQQCNYKTFLTKMIIEMTQELLGEFDEETIIDIREREYLRRLRQEGVKIRKPKLRTHPQKAHQ